MTFKPGEVDSGILFVRRNGNKPIGEIPCLIDFLMKEDRRTGLKDGDARVLTTEHVLSAVAGLGIDNLRIELSADETPSTDGSPKPFFDALKDAGIREQDESKRLFVIDEPISLREGDMSIAALPGPEDALEILYELDYPDTPSIGKQYLSFTLGKDDYETLIAPARTFLLKDEADQLSAQGIGKHLTTKDVLVFGDDGPIDNELRFGDEPVRHKIADLIGDLALAGRPLAGRIIASRSGHAMNHKLAMELSKAIERFDHGEKAKADRPPMDIHRILRLLPHRYPFLMVDRVIEIERDERAVGIKNVTINEPFFQGHYPDQPIMPGVLILEAMAQLSGLLLGRRLELSGKVAVLLSIDRVKMRRAVRPGDQLILEAEAVRMRTSTGHCRCRARVGDAVASEAEIKFMLIDADQV